MKTLLIIVLFAPLYAFSQQNAYWNIEASTATGRLLFINGLGGNGNAQVLNQGQSFRFNWQLVGTYQFALDEYSYMKIGLGFHQTGDRSRRDLLFPQQIDPNCGLCGPDPEPIPAQIATRLYFLQLPLSLGKVWERETHQLFGELTVGLQALFGNQFKVTFVETGEVASNESIFIVDNVIRPSFSGSFGWIIPISDRSSIGLGLYGKTLVVNTPLLMNNPVGNVMYPEIGLRTEWKIRSMRN